jgi:hypothetical protein
MLIERPPEVPTIEIVPFTPSSLSLLRRPASTSKAKGSAATELVLFTNPESKFAGPMEPTGPGLVGLKVVSLQPTKAIPKQRAKAARPTSRTLREFWFKRFMFSSSYSNH